MNNPFDDVHKIARLKEEFDQIDIPENLDSVISHAIKRGKKDLRKITFRKKILKSAATSIAAFALFALSLNTIPAFAESMSNLPIVGNLVKVLQFDRGQGSGGEITDGTKVQIGDPDKQGEYEIITINFMLEDNPTFAANYFEVTYREYPYSLIFDIPGARGFYDHIFPDPKSSKLVEDIYRLVTLDDSMQRFVITFKEAVEFEVLELADPAQIIVKLKEKPQQEVLQPVYSLRSGSYPFGESVGVIEGILRYEENGKDVRLLKDMEGTYFVEEGYYETEREALARMDELKASQLMDVSFYIEKREAGDIPRAIK
jgi:hypothetical protein